MLAPVGGEAATAGDAVAATAAVPAGSDAVAAVAAAAADAATADGEGDGLEPKDGVAVAAWEAVVDGEAP